MVEVLQGADGGRYPHGHSLLIAGRSGRALVDPSLTIADRGAGVPDESIDHVLISHCHEDHMAGLFRYPRAAVHVHAEDRIGLESLDDLMRIYGMDPGIEAAWRPEVVNRFRYVARPDAVSFSDGSVIDLGGTSLTAIHLPGHTRGHSGFQIEPDGVVFLADIDLTGFGPYYGDAWSSLEAFEETLGRCREIEANRYVTFHHKGVVTGRAEFLRLLDDYTAVIARREAAMLAYLREPRTVDEMVAHRFIYRPHVDLLFVDTVERRSAVLHLERLVRQGRVAQDGDRFMRVD